MRPARTTERWHRFIAKARQDGTWRRPWPASRCWRRRAREDEAEAIALILREVAETPGRTAALVTPDRLLARRVAVRLEAWGMAVEDSAGQPFAKTAIGALLDLAVEAAAKRFEPVALVCTASSIRCAGSACRPWSCAARCGALELAAFRTPYFGQGLDGVAAALERAQGDMREGKRRHRGVRSLKRDDWRAARKLVKRAGPASSRPLESCFVVGQASPVRRSRRRTSRRPRRLAGRRRR